MQVFGLMMFSYTSFEFEAWDHREKERHRNRERDMDNGALRSGMSEFSRRYSSPIKGHIVVFIHASVQFLRNAALSRLRASAR